MVAMVKEDLEKVPNLINPLKAKKLKNKKTEIFFGLFCVL